MAKFSEIVAALNAAEASYVIVGGFAGVLHGHTRFTADVDLVVRLDDANIKKVVEVATSLGYQPRLPVPATSFADAKLRKEWIDERGMTVFSFFDPKSPGHGIDLFARYPIEYDELVASATLKEFAGIAACVCSLDHLILMKRNAGRAQDLADLDVLEKIREHIKEA